MLISHTCPPSPFCGGPGARDGGIGITICDRGAEAGIDISVAEPGTDVPCFETIILDPDRCFLLGSTCRSTRA